MQIFNYFWYLVTEQIPEWVTNGPDIWFFLAGPGFILVTLAIAIPLIIASLIQDRWF